MCNVADVDVDVDLLTRGVGFVYIGSTITPLIYATFNLVFFVVETSIRAQPSQLTFNRRLVVGYLVQ